MICQKCHKNTARLRYAEVVDGKVTELHVCESCLQKLQGMPSAGFELSGQAPSPTRFKWMVDAAQRGETSRSCGSCGAKLSQVLNAGAAGCAACYEEFGEELEPVLRELHFSLRHWGKTPTVSDGDEQRRSDLQTKRSLLRSALQMENYEEAAQLRDAIRSLEEDLGLAGGDEDA
jgi:protein arginine kinase activator